MPIPPLPPAMLLVAAFAAGGHGKPDLHAQLRVTQAPQTVQLASPDHGRLKGWWSAVLGVSGVAYEITARVPHQVCASVTLTVPLRPGAQYEVRIYCKR